MGIVMRGHQDSSLGSRKVSARCVSRAPISRMQVIHGLGGQRSLWLTNSISRLRNKKTSEPATIHHILISQTELKTYQGNGAPGRAFRIQRIKFNGKSWYQIHLGLESLGCHSSQIPLQGGDPPPISKQLALPSQLTPTSHREVWDPYSTGDSDTADFEDQEALKLCFDTQK